MEAQIGLRDDPAVLCDLIHSHWINAPLFPDARIFLERCPVPIYIITNNGLPYMEQALRRNGLKAAGVVSADTARAYKPHREIFDETLWVSGCTPGEAVHIGDSYDTDVVGARGAGIRPVLLLRGREQRHDDVDTADGLEQALELVFPNGCILTQPEPVVCKPVAAQHFPKKHFCNIEPKSDKFLQSKTCRFNFG